MILKDSELIKKSLSTNQEVSIMKDLHNSCVCDYQSIDRQSTNQSFQQNSINNQRNCNSSGKESLPVLNTPDSGIIHSTNSLSDSSTEMANSNLESNLGSLNQTDQLKDENTALPNVDLNNQSNVLDDPFNYIIKNCKLDFEDNDDKVHFDFLTASQLQKIVSSSCL